MRRYSTGRAEKCGRGDIEYADLRFADRIVLKPGPPIAATAAAIDPFVDMLIVGDSLGMVLYGFETTLPVTLDMMIAHGGAVVRGSRRACVVVDLPFGSYQESPAAAFRSASRVLAETGCAAVKLEGGASMAETIAFLTARGVPVMGHVGLMPQSVMMSGCYRACGRSEREAARGISDAELWRLRTAACTSLVDYVRRRLAQQLERQALERGRGAVRGAVVHHDQRADLAQRALGDAADRGRLVVCRNDGDVAACVHCG